LRWIPATVTAPLLIRAIKLEGRTMVSLRRLENLYRVCTNPALPAGSLVECGVARGGCTALMSHLSAGRRPVWGFDSFEGMPELSAKDEGSGEKWVGYHCSGPEGLRACEESLRRFHAAGEWIQLVQGWFEHTLADHVARLAPIAVLRLDNDWYRSTRFCLEQLYPAVAVGGAVLIDDYHTFTGCRKAVDEFRAKRGIQDSLITTEPDSEAYWFKTR
jgi:O-methyltransferase